MDGGAALPRKEYTFSHPQRAAVTFSLPPPRPLARLYFFRYDLFRSQLLPNPVCMMYMAAGCLTSSNEALWVVSRVAVPSKIS